MIHNITTRQWKKEQVWQLLLYRGPIHKANFWLEIWLENWLEITW